MLNFKNIRALCCISVFALMAFWSCNSKEKLAKKTFSGLLNQIESSNLGISIDRKTIRSGYQSAFIHPQHLSLNYGLNKKYAQKVNGLISCFSQSVEIKDQNLSQSTTFTERTFGFPQQATKYLEGQKILIKGQSNGADFEKKKSKAYFLACNNKVYSFSTTYVDEFDCNRRLIHFLQRILNCDDWYLANEF